MILRSPSGTPKERELVGFLLHLIVAISGDLEYFRIDARLAVGAIDEHSEYV
jgi:hypothetical protein